MALGDDKIDEASRAVDAREARQVARDGVSESRFAEALQNVRQEIQSVATTTGVQIGAVEKTLSSKISNLKAWGIATIVGSNLAGGLLGAYLKADVTPVAAARGILRLFS